MRVLTALTIGMGVLILVGVTVLIVTIVKRAAVPATTPALALVLDEPPGTKIAGLTAVADRLAIDLSGGGPDRVVLVDPRSGQIVGRIALRR
jgi:hypothetical protein